jgi:hypothetical protein
MADDFVSDTDILGSKLPANNGYGQNGFTGPSSDLPGQHTTSGFLPQSTVPTDKWQTREVSKEQLKSTFGMTGPAPSAKIAPYIHRKA